MSENKKYNINIYGLKSGVHNFDFEYDDKIFVIDEFTIVEKGQGTCKVQLEKSDTMITLNFKIEGSVGLVCDRSLEAFDMPIDLENKLILKYGNAFNDEDDLMWIIPDTTQTFNVARNILEFINVSIPIKRLHPKFGEDEGSEEVELVYSSEPIEDNEPNEEIADPRWAALKDLKKNT